MSSSVNFRARIRVFFIFGLCVLLALLSSADEQFTNDYTIIPAVVDQTVQLPCSLPKSKPPRVEWSDLVYNTDRKPKKIFTASGNRRTIEMSHPRRNNFDVDLNFMLEIRNVTVDDAGTYLCTSKLNESYKLDKRFYLAVRGHLNCYGNATLSAGDRAKFRCESTYSGNHQPQLEWIRGTEPVLDSIDNFDVRLARKEFDLEASAGDDESTFTCRLTFGKTEEECHINLTVFYTVRDLVIDPQKESYAVGEEIRCSANGNPTPDIFFIPSYTEKERTTAWRSVTIPNSLLGQRTQLECVASNTVNGRFESLRKTISFTVTAPELNGKPNDKPTEEKPNTTKGESSSGAIVGGIVVGIMILVIVVAVVFWLRLRNEKKPKKEENGGTKAQVSARDGNQMKENEHQV